MASFRGIVFFIRNMILLGVTTKKSFSTHPLLPVCQLPGQLAISDFFFFWRGGGGVGFRRKDVYILWLSIA